jgi:hypothetical protein
VFQLDGGSRDVSELKIVAIQSLCIQHPLHRGHLTIRGVPIDR